MRPNKSKAEIAEELADFFVQVSNEHTPHNPSDTPTTYSSPYTRKTLDEMTKMIKEIKKPHSMIPGDVMPSLLTPMPKRSRYLPVE